MVPRIGKASLLACQTLHLRKPSAQPPFASICPYYQTSLSQTTPPISPAPSVSIIPATIYKHPENSAPLSLVMTQPPAIHVGVSVFTKSVRLAKCSRRPVFVKNIQFLSATNDIIPEDGKHYVTIFMVYQQDNDMFMPTLLEPEKCAVFLWVQKFSTYKYSLRTQSSKYLKVLPSDSFLYHALHSELMQPTCMQ